MDRLEERTLGQLLAQYRTRINRNGSDVLQYIRVNKSPNQFWQYWSTDKLSKLENDHTQRPDVEILRAFATYYNLDEEEFTYVLRASDHPATEEELHDMALNYKPILAKFPMPAYVINYRYELVLWNDAFELLYGAESNLLTREAVDTLSELPGADEEDQGGSVPQGAQNPPGQETIDLARDQPLRLQPGMSLLLLLWSRQSRFRQQLAYDEWERFVEFLLVRFWRSVRPLLNSEWAQREGGVMGQPIWLVDLLQTLEGLPSPDGSDFAKRSQRIRALLESNRRDPQVKLTRRFLFDRAYFRQGSSQFEWETSSMEDARYTLIRHILVD